MFLKKRFAANSVCTFSNDCICLSFLSTPKVNKQQAVLLNTVLHFKTTGATGKTFLALLLIWFRHMRVLLSSVLTKRPDGEIQVVFCRN